MTNPYYNHGSFPATNSAGASASMRAELDAITAGFNKLPGTLTANNIIFVNVSGTGLEARAGIDGIVIGGTTPAAGTFTALTAATLALSSALTLPSGTVGAPGATFTGDTDNGWWRPAADTQAWSIAGAEKLRLNGTGFGVGTNNPQKTFVVANGTAAGLEISPTDYAGNMRMLAYDRTAAGYVALRTEASQYEWLIGGTEGMRLDPSRNLLLGTTTGNGTRLKVDSSNNPWFTFGSSSLPSAYGQFFRGGTTTIGGYIGFDGGALVGTGTGTGFVVRSEGDLILMASAAERVRVNSNGNVGVGIAPQLWGSGRRAIEIGGSGDQSYVMGQNSINLMVNSYYDGTNFRSVNAAVGGLYQMSSNTHAWFSTSNGGAGGISTLTQNMTLDGSANLGIGAGLTPLRPLHIKSATSEIVRLETTTARGSGQIALAFLDPTGQKGYVGYGSANDKFEIINQLNADMNFYTNATLRMSIQAAGTIIDGAGLELGYKGLPAASVTTGAFAAGDRGKCVYATAGVTIPNSTMAATDTVIVQNTTGSAITITKSITTAYNTSSGAALGATFTLGARGRMAIVFNSSTECYVSGNIS